MLAGRKSFGEKVARDMEDSWAAATGQRIALVSPGEGAAPVQQTRPAWPFRAPYDDYVALPPEQERTTRLYGVGLHRRGRAPYKKPRRIKSGP